MTIARKFRRQMILPDDRKHVDARAPCSGPSTSMISPSGLTWRDSHVSSRTTTLSPAALAACGGCARKHCARCADRPARRRRNSAIAAACRRSCRARVRECESRVLRPRPDHFSRGHNRRSRVIRATTRSPCIAVPVFSAAMKISGSPAFSLTRKRIRPAARRSRSQDRLLPAGHSDSSGCARFRRPVPARAASGSIPCARRFSAPALSPAPTYRAADISARARRERIRCFNS